MKEYMMLFIGDDYADMGLSPEQIQQRMGKWGTWYEKMAKAGVVKSGEALHAPTKVVSGKERTVTDRAGAETKELIGGYYIVTAKNADEVVKIADDFPDYDLGSKVEIREVMVFDQQ